MLDTERKTFDVAIVGGGIGGSTLGSILARHGISTVLIEAGSHPRFTIGESTVSETTLGFRALAQKYDVPEIRNLTTHGKLRRHVSTGSGIKRNFSFVWHEEGERFRATQCTQVPTWSPPIGPDSHFLRQDVDAYMYQVALSYGAVGVTNSPVTGVDFDADGATLHTANRGDYRAKFVVDAGGMKSVLGEQLQLRVDPEFKTRSRTIFSHFVGVEPFDSIAPPRSEHKMPSPFAEGTLHHMFKGGWAWVIPFDNHVNSTSKLCSVGINLDIDQYPMRDGETPEEEFWAHIRRFPDFYAQMKNAQAVRPFVASTRSQFSSRQLVGERWCLLPHASDFIDPLFSSGLAVTGLSLIALGQRLIDAVREDDFSVDRFEYVQTWTKNAFAYYDTLVSNSYTAFDDFELWNAWHRVWALGTIYGSSVQIQAVFAYEKTKDRRAFEVLEQQPYRGAQAIDNPAHATLMRTASAIMQDYRDKDIEAPEAARRIYTAIADSGLSPGPMKMLDPECRNPARTFSLLPLLRLIVWGRFNSPPHVRGKFFTVIVQVAVQETLRFYGAELKRSGTNVYQATRDMFVVGNRDWHRMGSRRRQRAVR